jgi:ankyrin repeat protein
MTLPQYFIYLYKQLTAKSRVPENAACTFCRRQGSPQRTLDFLPEPTAQGLTLRAGPLLTRNPPAFPLTLPRLAADNTLLVLPFPKEKPLKRPVLLALVAVLFTAGQQSWAVAYAKERGGKHGQKTLSIAIVSTKGQSGSSIINRAGTFQVRLTNRSSKPIRLWKEGCHFGYEVLSFRAEGSNGKSSLMKKTPRSLSDWENHPPKTFSIPPGGTFSWEVSPSGIWGEREWKNVPEPNTGEPVRFRAILEIRPTGAAKMYGVWTGKVTSEPVQALFVDPKLRTPHQYLEAHCPNQALRLIRADPKWVKRRDRYQQTPLHIAARWGFKKVVRRLLAQGANVNATAYNGFTPLHLAADPAVVKLLLKFKADVNAGGASETALERAASNYAHLGQYSDPGPGREKWRAITKILLRAGARYDLHSACYLGDVTRVRSLVAEKKQARDKEALRIAAMYGRAKIVKLFLDHGADPEDADDGGLPVSYFAVEHPRVLKLLFDAGANPKITLRYRGNGKGPNGSLLHKAADKGIIESAKLLLARGVKVDVRTPSGSSPLHWACGAGQVRMVKFLLKNKANAKSCTKGGWTPMSLAASEVRPEMEEDNARYQGVIRALERAGAKVDVFAAIACNDVRRVAGLLWVDPQAGARRDPTGRPALHQAVMLDRREIVKLLLGKGCDPNVRSKDKRSGHEGETALVVAAFWGRVKIAAMLIRRRANVNVRAVDGVAPLHEAARMGHLKLCRLLLKHGADINAEDTDGNTPLGWAREYEESAAVLKLLRDHGAKGRRRQK